MSESKPTRPKTAHIPPFGLRLQPELKEKIVEAAISNGRSVNAEIVARLEQSLSSTSTAPSVYNELHRMLEEVQKLYKNLAATQDQLLDEKKRLNRPKK